jgi:hypothetical protein
MPFVRKNLFLLRQKRAAGIDHVDAGQPVLACDILRTQVLLHGQRIIRAALDGRIVGDDDALTAGDAADASDDACRMHVAAIEAEGCERREFEKGGAGIDQQIDAFARQHLAARRMAAARDLAATAGNHLQLLPEVGDQRSHRCGVLRVAFRAPVDFGMKNGHAGDGNVICRDCNRP